MARISGKYPVAAASTDQRLLWSAICYG
jgi:hypothetical protein